MSDGDGVYVSGCQMLQLNDASTSAAAATVKKNKQQFDICYLFKLSTLFFSKAAGAALLVRQYFIDGW